MSLFDNLASVASGALSGNFSAIVFKAKEAVKDGVSPNSPLAHEVADLILKQFPQLKGRANIVQAIDDLIPDGIQSKYGFTPEVMTFIKQALGSAHALPKNIQK